MRDWPIDPDTFSHLATAAKESPHAGLKEKLAVVIDNLDPQLRDLVNAVVWERVAKREMARRLNLRRPDVDKMLHQAFEQIRVAMGWSRDAYYEAKKVRGLLESPADYLSDDELRATLTGRSRGDGRRIDAYCLDEPVGWERAGSNTIREGD